MSGFLNKIRDINRNHIVFYVFTIYLLITYILLAFLILSGLDYKDYILRDDGYYFMAKNFGKGIFNSGSVIGPGLPFIYAPIHFFNENLHPFIRLSISHIAVLIILFTVSKLTITYLNDRQLFWGLLMVIIHPVFIQWTFRTSVDLYLSLFLGVFILYLIKYIDKGRIINLFFSFLAYSYAIFIRPSFICIPLVLLLSSLVILKSRKIILISFALLITTGVCFYANNIYLLKNSGSKKITADSGRSFVILQSFVLTETILKTKQFHKGDVDNYNVEDSLSGARYIYKNVNEYIANYNNKYPNGSPVHMVLKYIIKKPGIFIAKVLLTPIFFFCLSSREIVSYLLLLFFIAYSVLVWISLKPLLADTGNKQYFVILFSALSGYFLLHWITHAYSRYLLTILPYLFVWTGPHVIIIIKKIKFSVFKNIKNENNNSSQQHENPLA